MKLYQITAQIERRVNGWISLEGVPTFYLRDDMQGIANEEHAETVARSMIENIARDESIRAVHVSVSVSNNFNPSVIGA